MARYSTVLLPYSLYDSSIYGDGDNPDLRIKYFRALPTDSARKHLDADGRSVFGRVTVFWDTFSSTGFDVKILRSTHGPAITHNDPFCTVVAATKQQFDIADVGAMRFADGFTVVSTTAPHLLRVGDTVTIGGNDIADGTWVVNSVPNPAQFGFRHTVAQAGSATGGAVTVEVGRFPLPKFGVGEKYFTDTSVVPGVEYHYSLFLEDPSPAVTEWHYAGSTTIRAPKDFNSFQRLIDITPSYLTNNRIEIDGVPSVDALRDTDYDLMPSTEANMTKVFAGMGWVWDEIRTDLAAVSRPWSAYLLPDAALAPALDTVGITNVAALSNRSLRMLLDNSAAINKARGTSNSLATLAECYTGMSASISGGYNIMPSVDDAEFHWSPGHWVCSPAGVDNATSGARSLTSTSPVYSGGDTVAPGVFISPESEATLDTATTASTALTFAGTDAESEVHVGFGAAVSGVSPSTYTASKTYTIETHFPHGLEPGDSVTMTSVFPMNNETSFPYMIVTSVPSPTTVVVLLRTDISPGDYNTFFGDGTPYNMLAMMPGRRNPFAVSNGVAIEPRTTYTFSHEGTFHPSSEETVTPSTEAYFFDAYGNYLGRHILGGESSYDSGLAYDDGTTSYDASAPAAYEVGNFSKFSITFTTPEKSRYMALRVRVLTADTTLTHYLRRFCVVEGGTAYPYQSPRLVSLDLTSAPSATTWGPPRTNLIFDPSFADGRTLSLGSDMTGAAGTFSGKNGYQITVGTGATTNAIGSSDVALPGAGTYTASAYYAGSNADARTTSVRLTLGGFTDGYAAWEYPDNTLTNSTSTPPVEVRTHLEGPARGSLPVTGEWLTDNKDLWYDQQPVFAVALPDAEDRSDILNQRVVAELMRTSGGGSSSRVTVSKGTEYRGGVFVRVPSATARVGVAINWYDTAGRLLETSPGRSVVLLPTNKARDYSWVTATGSPSNKVNVSEVTVLTATSSGTTRTITTEQGHGLASGNEVTVVIGDAAYDGTYTVTVTGSDTFTYTATSSTSSSATLSTYPRISVERGVATATLSVYIVRMTDDLCGQEFLITCPSLLPSKAPEVFEFLSADLSNNTLERAHIKFRVSDPTNLTLSIGGRAMGTSPVEGAVYFTDDWLVESGDLLLGYFDGSADYQIAPYYAGTNDDGTASTGRTLPQNAVADFTDGHVNATIGLLKAELPNNIAFGIPYRVTINGQINNVPVSSIDPTFNRTYQPSLY